jgi:hypothetical protein
MSSRKRIEDMNIEELARACMAIDSGYQESIVGLQSISERLLKLHDLTRWIPVSERMPTVEDSYRGRVLWLQEEYSIIVGSYDLARSKTRATHWQRITPPEDK